jgi:phosphatidylglycerophosphatase A
LNRFAQIIATLFGMGHIRPAPGTWGSLGALPLGIGIFYAGGPMVLFISIVAVFILGVRASEIYDKENNTKDNSSIVIDEVAGQWIPLLIAGLNPALIIASFLFFRLFDITKPWPCRRLEKLPGGYGVMADDIAAGIYALLCVGILKYAGLG